MYCRNYTGTISHVLCREVCYTVSLFGGVHHQRFTEYKSNGKTSGDCTLKSLFLVSVGIMPANIPANDAKKMKTKIPPKSLPARRVCDMQRNRGEKGVERVQAGEEGEEGERDQRRKREKRQQVGRDRVRKQQ